MNFFRKHAFYFGLAVLLVANVFVWHVEHTERPGNMMVAFLNVGQGDAIYVRSPSGNDMLIDAGFNSAVLSELSQVMSFYDRHIDVLLATHPDADHIGGMPGVVSRFSAGVFLESGADSESNADDALRELVKKRGVAVLEVRRGTVVDFGDGAVFEILHPVNVSGMDTNDASIMGILSFGNHSFMLTGDAPMSAEQALVAAGDNVSADVLKAGHHGSRTSSISSFVEAVGAEYSVISAGKNNRYGHPHKEVTDTLSLAGAAIIGTYEKGRIIFETDGETLKLR